MPFLDEVSVLILTWNEAANIGRSVSALGQFSEVLVLDGNSTDETVSLADAFPNVRLAFRAFDNHANQWNYGLSQCGIASEWVLALDADYVVSPLLIKELESLQPEDNVAGYWISFNYCVEGKPLTGSLYPPVAALFRRSKSHYVQDGHTQRVELDGAVKVLKAKIDHDDRKPLSRWLASQDRYADLECSMLCSREWSELRWRDRLRKLAVVTPWLVPLYVLLVQRCLLDGRAGLYYAFQRSIAEAILSLKLLEVYMRRSSS